MDRLKNLISEIGDLDAKAMEAAAEHQNQLTKPQGSLGVLEKISIRLAGIQGKAFPEITKKTAIVMAGDHGIAEEGTSAYPSEVTAQMVMNFSRGGAAVNVLARHNDVDVIIVDVGVKEDIECPGVLDRKIRCGTANMVKGPAMTRQEAEKAILVGVEVAEKAIESGSSVIAIGDMGIGNTSPSSAIISVLGGMPVELMVGRGTGIDDEAFQDKVIAITKAISINKPDPDDPVDVLSKVGGLEIAGLSGVILECALKRIPVVIDGFIAGAAAFLAAKMAPKSINFMIASHLSAEQGHRRAMAEIGLAPMLHMDMRLGEGTGAVLAINIIEAAVKIIREMATFSEASVSTSRAETTMIPEK